MTHLDKRTGLLPLFQDRDGDRGHTLVLSGFMLATPLQ